MSEQEIPVEEQERLARELAEELKKLRVEDVVLNALMTLSSIGYRCLGLTEDSREDRDLGQVQLAIDTMRALTPVLEQVVPAELLRDFNSAVANLQLAYAKAAAEGGAAGEAPPPPDAADAAAAPPDDDSSAG